MASNFSANQYDMAFSAKSLCNWQVPHWYPKYPRRGTDVTQFIANDRGHLLPDVERPKSSPWGNFKGTWQLPNIITRKMAEELSAPQFGTSRWTRPEASRKKKLNFNEIVKEEPCDDVNRAESSELMRSITPFEHGDSKKEAHEEAKEERKFNEKEKLNDPIAISKGGKRAIRHETLERDNDLH